MTAPARARIPLSHNAQAQVLRFLDFCIEKTPRSHIAWDEVFPRDGWLVGLQIYGAFVWWCREHDLPLLPMSLVMQFVGAHVEKQSLDVRGTGVYLAKLKPGVHIFGQSQDRRSLTDAARALVAPELERLKKAREAVKAREARRREKLKRRRRTKGEPTPAAETKMLRAMPIVDVDAAIADAEKLLEDL
jgi:hypothetical protein